MEQTTDTSDLTETEKYLNGVNETSCDSDSDSDTEEEVAQDILLGGIRSGLSTITKTARKALSTCKNKTELESAAQGIEESTLKLLKLEKTFLKTANIVSDVIDDLASDFEDDEELIFLQNGNGRNECTSKMTSFDAVGSGDASYHATQEPYIFRVSEKNLASVINFKEQLAKEYHKRVNTYENTLTDAQLKQDKKFRALLDQIKLGKNDAQHTINKELENAAAAKIAQQLDDDHEEEHVSHRNSVSSFLSNLPFTAEEMLKYQYKPYNEDEDMDHSVIPSIDPISKNPICFPLRNKYCNHVFDRESIYNYISDNPTTTCPVHMCRNKKTLAFDHFVSDATLTSHVRQKNNLE